MATSPLCSPQGALQRFYKGIPPPPQWKEFLEQTQQKQSENRRSSQVSIYSESDIFIILVSTNVLQRSAICFSLNPRCHVLTDCSGSVDQLLWNGDPKKYEKDDDCESEDVGFSFKSGGI